MGRRKLLTDEERRLLFDIPTDRDQLVRLYTLSKSDRALIDARRRSSNRLGFALQLALLRHSGVALQFSPSRPQALITYLAEQLGLDASAVDDYAQRGQTLTDHGRELATALGMRPPTAADLSMMIEAASIAAWATDKGLPIAIGIIASLREANIILPATAVIERTGAAGRVRARKRVSEALLAGLNDDQLAGIDGLLAVDAKRGLSNLAWLKAMPTSPKADHVREIVDRLVHIRKFGISADRADAIHPDRFRQLVREGRGAHAYLLDRYSVQRRRAVLVAFAIDIEARLTDATIEMADKLIGGAFTRARNTEERSSPQPPATSAG